MSPSPESSRAPRRVGPARRVVVGLALAAVAGTAVWLTRDRTASAAPQGGATAVAGSTQDGLSVPAGSTAGSPFGSGASAAIVLPALPPAARATAGEIGRLAALPPGDDAIALARRLEDTADAASLPAWREALLRSPHPAVERSAISVLARLADAETITALGEDYGRLPPEWRGRILQVLEQATRPEALDGLVHIVEADTGEKRSALAMSALQGLAHLGTMDSTDYLLQQVRSSNIDHALMALGRVSSRQGVEMTRAAAAGSRGFEGLDAGVRQALLRSAAAAEGQLARP